MLCIYFVKTVRVQCGSLPFSRRSHAVRRPVVGRVAGLRAVVRRSRSHLSEERYA